MNRLVILILISVLSTISSAQSTASERTDLKTANLIRVGERIHVSGTRPDRLQWEPVIASDPDNPKNLLACVIDGDAEGGRPRSFIVIYSSFDGGKSWRITLEIVNPKEAIVDPSCAFGSGGIAYATTLPRSSPIFRSRDSGRTWQRVADLRPSTGDRQFITVDNTKGPYQGRVYYHYVAAADMIATPLEAPETSRSIEVWRSSDFGKKFYGPGRLASKSGLMMGNATILSDGTFTAIAAERGEPSLTGPANSRIVVMQSKADSRGFSASAAVSKWYSEGTYEDSCVPLPSVSSDTTSGVFKDRIYAVWSDSRRGRLEMIVSHSADKGKTWSDPRFVRANALGSMERNSCTAAVAVNKDGVVGVIWYERVDHPDNKIQDRSGKLVNNVSHEPWFSASLDGGETFQPPVKLSSDDIKPKRFRIGETIGLGAGPDGKFHALWIENRTGIPQLYYAPVTVTGRKLR